MRSDGQTDVTKLLRNIFRRFSNTLDKNAQYYVKLNIDKSRVICFYRKMYEINYNYNNQIGLHDICIIRNTTKIWECFWIVTFPSPIFMKSLRFLVTWIAGTHEHFNILFYIINCLLLSCTSVRSKLECTVPPMFAVTSRLPVSVSWNASKGNLRFVS